MERREIKFKRVAGIINDILIDKDTIIKNRLGPYRILLKIEEIKKYFGSNGSYIRPDINNSDYAFDYNSIGLKDPEGLWVKYKAIKTEGMTPTIWLTTQSGLIELLESDFHPQFRDEPKEKENANVS
jgi:hypothetical protein